MTNKSTPWMKGNTFAKKEEGAVRDKRITLRVTEKEQELYKKQAEILGVTISQMFLNAVDEMINKSTM